MHTIVELPEFLSRSEKLMTDEERRLLLNYISEQPLSGAVIQGTGGIRKLRWSTGTKGKSGGVRVIYYVHNMRIPIFAITVYSKSDRDNLTQGECNQLEKLVKLLIERYQRH